MKKAHPKNERIKRKYFQWLETAKGKKFIIAAGIESQATRAADHFRSESEKAQAEMDRAYAAGDSVAFDAAVKSRNMADGGRLSSGYWSALDTVLQQEERSGD